MTRWNPNLFRKDGLAKGFNPEYLGALIAQGESLVSNQMPVVFSLAHLASLSRTLYSDLHGFVSRSDIQRKDFPYRSFPIAKRSGGVRWISIPAPPLMAVQQWICQNVLNRVEPHAAAYAFVPRRRLLDHAQRHCGATWLVKVDIKDFFSNISERQAFQVFLRLGYPKLLSFEMARLCTRVTPRRKGAKWTNSNDDHSIPEYDCRFVGSLPQGAPTSPALSNLVCMDLDRDLTELAVSKSATFSRYADDLCFSLTSGSREAAFALKRDVSKVLWKHGFSENPKKTRVVPPGARMVLTGLLVNANVPTVPREVRDLVRMHLHYAKKNGIPMHCKARGFRSIFGFKNHLLGLIGYVASVDKKHGADFYAQFNQLPWIEFDL
ncbi:MAG: RNA-directed DNA polymerase [Betaproteobacteria bacterium]|nr:RNA-directed DNA polymerase [Betaproteobacteria bacterium]